MRSSGELIVAAVQSGRRAWVGFLLNCRPAQPQMRALGRGRRRSLETPRASRRNWREVERVGAMSLTSEWSIEKMFGHIRLSVLGTALASATAVASCGGSTPQAEAPSAADGEASESGEQKAAAPASAVEETAWADMDREQRLEFMGTVVMPAMEKMFKEYDAEGFGEFGCKTCHGEDMEAVDYKLPNGLYALPASDPVAAAKDYDAEVTAFMLDKVTPQMAELLGEEVTCMSCHEAE